MKFDEESNSTNEGNEAMNYVDLVTSGILNKTILLCFLCIVAILYFIFLDPIDVNEINNFDNDYNEASYYYNIMNNKSNETLDYDVITSGIIFNST